MSSNGTPGQVESTTQSGFDLLAQALGLSSNGAALNSLLQLVLPQVAPNLSVGLGGTLITDSTAMGLYNRSVSESMDALQRRLADTYTKRSMSSMFELLERNTHSQADYLKRAGIAADNPEADALYNKYIDDKVKGWMDKPFIDTVFNLVNSKLDLGGTHTLSTNMGRLASSTAMWGVRSGLARRGYGNGMYLAENLLAGDLKDGKFAKAGEWNAADWGGFNMGGVSGIAAALSEQTNLLEGMDEGSSDQLNQAVLRLRSRLKSLTEALSPLREVFGNDTKKMLNVIQGVTGQDIAQLSSERVQSIASDIAYHVTSGHTDLAGYSALSGHMAKGMAIMNGLGTYNLLSADKQASAVLDFTGKGQNPGYMRDVDFAAGARMLVSQTYNSPAADMVAKAYSIWQHRNAGKDFKDFQIAVDDKLAADKNMDLRDAVLKTAGIQFAAELQEGYAYGGYAEAVKSGMAGYMASSGLLHRTISDGEYKAGNDFGFRRAVGDDDPVRARRMYQAAIAVARAGTGIIKMSEKDRADWMATKRYGKDDLFTLADGTRKKLGDMTSAERLQALSRLQGIDIGGLSDEETKKYLDAHYHDGVLSLYTDEERTRINHALNYMQGNRDFRPAMDAIAYDNARIKSQQDRAVYENRQVQMEKLNKQVLSSDGIIGLFKGKDGFTVKALYDRLSYGTAAKMFQDDAGYMYTAVTAAGELANVLHTQDGKLDEKASSKDAMHIIRYLMSTEGMANNGATDVLDTLRNMYMNNTGSADERLALQRRLASYAYLGQDLAERMYKDGGGDATAARMLETDASKRANFVRYDILEHLGTTAQQNSPGIEDMIKEYRAYTEKNDPNAAFGTNFEEFLDDQRSQDGWNDAWEKQASILRDLVNSIARSGGGGKSADILVMIYTLMYNAIKLIKPDAVKGMSAPGAIQSSNAAGTQPAAGGQQQ